MGTTSAPARWGLLAKDALDAHAASAVHGEQLGGGLGGGDRDRELSAAVQHAAGCNTLVASVGQRI